MYKMFKYNEEILFILQKKIKPKSNLITPSPISKTIEKGEMSKLLNCRGGISKIQTDTKFIRQTTLFLNKLKRKKSKNLKIRTDLNINQSQGMNFKWLQIQSNKTIK